MSDQDDPNTDDPTESDSEDPSGGTAESEPAQSEGDAPTEEPETGDEESGAETPEPDDAAALDAAAEDADQNLDESEVGEPVQGCAKQLKPAPAPPVNPPAPPPPGNLKVHVTDAKSGNAIANANVSISGPENHADKTDAGGNVAFNGIAPGTYTVNVTADGYAPASATPSVSSATTTNQNVQLTPATVSLTLDGVAAGDKVTVGGLLVRNFDANSAPRKKVTISAVSPAGAVGNAILQCDSAKVKFFDAASGGSAIAIDGAANAFAAGSLPKDVFAEGVTASDAMRDINISLDFGPWKKVDAATLTVLWLDKPAIRFSGDVSANNARVGDYPNWTKAHTTKLGLQEFTAGTRIGWGSEASAKVHPAKFIYPGSDLKLERDYDFKDYNGNTVKDSGSRSATLPPGNDTSAAAFRDDNPDPDDTIYDLDGAGLPLPNAPANTIHRTRNNFLTFASITAEGKSVRCSEKLEYFISFSQIQTAAPSGTQWQVKTPPDVAGDNQAGNGTTKLTWDLS